MIRRWSKAYARVRLPAKPPETAARPPTRQGVSKLINSQGAGRMPLGEPCIIAM